MIPRRIVSGAQTGADRAALDAALELGAPTGGWVPRGRRAEDGRIADRYPNLRETDGDEYETRTRWNVRDSDATLILAHGPLTGGSAFTQEVARELGKPVLYVDLDAAAIDDAVRTIRAWLATLSGDTLNVAGPRASKDPLIYEKTREIVKALLLDA
ncbi:MAG TPA: putative molybdenum carrier protein [Candidatus Krumholzibacteria bacterium]|nr:putative molybdenum carrier protein [Candidatus Krumholzibacteria bacterium]